MKHLFSLSLSLSFFSFFLLLLQRQMITVIIVYYYRHRTRIYVCVYFHQIEKHTGKTVCKNDWKVNIPNLWYVVCYVYVRIFDTFRIYFYKIAHTTQTAFYVKHEEWTKARCEWVGEKQNQMKFKAKRERQKNWNTYIFRSKQHTHYTSMFLSTALKSYTCYDDGRENINHFRS